MGMSVTTVLRTPDFEVDCIVSDTQWRQNCYLVSHRHSKELILIDPGGCPDDIIPLIHEAGVGVRRILITHPHHDHIGGAAEVSDYFKVPCELHKADMRLLKQAPMYAMMFAGKALSIPDSLVVFDEESFCMSERFPLQVLHTPGHTKGSVCYLLDGCVFTGDTILCRHVGRTDLPGSNSEDLSLSVEKILNGLADAITLLPGHGAPWTVGEARAWWHESRNKPPAHTSFVDRLS